MKTIICEIPEEVGYVIPISDLHYSDKSFTKNSLKILKGNLEWVKQHPNARIVLVGDIFNGATRESKTSPFDQKDTEFEELVELFKPYASQIVTAIDGNHEKRIEDFANFSLMNAFCIALGIPYSHKSVAINFKVNKRPGNNGFRHQYIGYFHHTTGGGKTSGSKLSRIESMTTLLTNADFYVGGHCFSEDTEILTKRGWIKGFDLLCNDKVGTMNKKTKKFEWNNVNSFHQYDNYKELYYIKGSTVDLLVTDKHGLIYENEDGKLEEIESRRMLETKGKMLFLNCAESNDKNNYVYIEDNIIRLLINITTDGSFEKGGVRWHLKKERKIAHLKELLTKLNLPFSEHKTNIGTTKIRLFTKDAKPFIEMIGDTKILPEFIRNLHSSLVPVVLDEYSITDGCKNSHSINSYQLSSFKEKEIDILQELFVKNGYRATKTSRKNGFILTVNTRRGTILIKNNVSIKEYEGRVWCVNVDNGTLLVRRNGKTTITLNTHQIGAVPIISREYNTRTNKIEERRQLLVGGGGYLEWDESYAEGMMLRPLKIGSPRIRLDGKKEHKDIHCNI